MFQLQICYEILFFFMCRQLNCHFSLFLLNVDLLNLNLKSPKRSHEVQVHDHLPSTDCEGELSWFWVGGASQKIILYIFIQNVAHQQKGILMTRHQMSLYFRYISKFSENIQMWKCNTPKYSQISYFLVWLVSATSGIMKSRGNSSGIPSESCGEFLCFLKDSYNPSLELGESRGPGRSFGKKWRMTCQNLRNYELPSRKHHFPCSCALSLRYQCCCSLACVMLAFSVLNLITLT